MDIHDFLSRLEGVKGGGGQYTALCPAHGDRRNSISVSVGKDGRILLHCHAGCEPLAVAESMGLTMRDLFTEISPGEAFPAYSTPKGDKHPIVATYSYLDQSGKLLAQKLRRADKSFSWRHPDSAGNWVWSRKGVPNVLYNLPVISTVGALWVVEGEKDVNTLTGQNQPAVCGADGAGPGKWIPAYTEALRGKKVIVVQDNDEVGKAFAAETANALHGVAQSVKVLDLTRIWPGLPEHGDTTDLYEHMGPDGIAAMVAAAMDTPEWEPATTETRSTEWETPVPFDSIDTPDFPTERLPGPLSAFVECLAESTQTPEEMAGILSLGVLSTAFQSKYEVEITPDWREPLCLYTVAVAPPWERKSAVISALTRPVYEYEAERRELEAAEIAQNQTERALLEKALQAAQTRATKGKKADQDAGREEALALSAELAEFQDKHPFRLLVDDTTPEKLVYIMDMQGGCITVASAEGGVFDSMSGRYDRGANFDVCLKGHAGDPITVDRIGRKPNHIKDPRLTMMLTIQPKVLSGLMGNATMRGRGLCGRFLYVMCKSKVGRRAISPAPVPEAVRADYRQFVRRILADQGGGLIRLSAEADRIRQEYAAYIEQRLGDEWEHMRDWGGKLVGAMVRIAALMHAAVVQGSPAETPISPEVMGAAVGIAEFLGPHAEAAYQVMGADQDYEDAKYLWRRIEGTGQDELTKNELLQLTRGKFKKAENMEPALNTLIDMGYVRRENRKTGGRPSEIILVNPFSKARKDSKAIA